MNLVFIFAAFSWQNSINYKVMGWTFQGLKTEFCVFNTSHSAHELHGRLLLDMSVLHHSSVHLFTVLKYLHQSLKPRSDLHVSRRRCFSSFTAAEHEGTQSLQLKCKSAPSLLKKKKQKNIFFFSRGLVALLKQNCQVFPSGTSHLSSRNVPLHQISFWWTVVFAATCGGGTHNHPTSEWWS